MAVMPVYVVESHRALLCQLLPDDDPDRLDVRQGQFTDVVVGADRVVCLPRTPAAAARLPARAAGLRTLAALDLGFRTPEPLLEGRTPGTDELTFLVLSRIPGAPLPANVLDDPQVARAVASQYATLLTRLAAAGAGEAARATLPLAPEGRWQQFAAGVRTKLFSLMSDNGRKRAERELMALDGLLYTTHAVVHGDLGAANVLWEKVDGLPHIAGVVDWDGVELGDPAEDLAAIGASNGDSLLEQVREIGAWLDRDLPNRIATIRATFALQQALTAFRDGDEAELDDGLAHYS